MVYWLAVLEYRKVEESIGKNIEKDNTIMNDNSTTVMNNTTQSTSAISNATLAYAQDTEIIYSIINIEDKNY